MLKLIYYVLLVFIASFIEFIGSGPDSKLYLGLAYNIFDGLGYIDTIRNDEVLPSIGYPAFIAFFMFFGMTGDDANGYLFSYTLMVVSLIVIFESFRRLRINEVVALLLIILWVSTLPKVNIWGVEPALIFSLSLLFYSLVMLKVHPNAYSALFVALALLLSILIRPLFLPFVAVLCPVVFWYAASRYKMLLWPLIVFLGGLFMVGGQSLLKYGDLRFVSGTYSEIPLYCAWNKYIPLEQNYRSSRWAAVPQSLRNEAIAPLQNVNGWEDRAKRIKISIKKFIVDEPKKAFDGYVWRLSKYTVAPDELSFFKKGYAVLGYIWFVSFLLALVRVRDLGNKEKVILVIVTVFVTYMFATIAAFVFVGNRSYVVPSLLLLLSLGYFLHIIKIKDLLYKFISEYKAL